MSEDNLSTVDKVRLLATMDAQHPNNFDAEFLALLLTCEPPTPDVCNDRKRRAIMKFVNAYWENQKGVSQALDMDNDTIVKAGLHYMLTLGYELGRKLRSPLTRK